MNDDEQPDRSRLIEALTQGIKQAVHEGATSGAVEMAAQNPDARVVAIGAGVAGFLGFCEHYLLNGQTEAVARAIRAEQARDLEDVAPRLVENMRTLKDAGHVPTASDIAGTFAHWNEAWMRADPKTRQLLKHAFAAAFEPELYEAGIVNDLLRLVQTLSYGELRLLAVAVQDELLSDAVDPPIRDGFSSDYHRCTAPLFGYHMGRLEKAGLATKSDGRGYKRTDGASSTRYRVIATPLGKHLAKLLGEARLAEDLGSVPRS